MRCSAFTRDTCAQNPRTPRAPVSEPPRGRDRAAGPRHRCDARRHGEGRGVRHAGQGVAARRVRRGARGRVARRVGERVRARAPLGPRDRRAARLRRLRAHAAPHRRRRRRRDPRRRRARVDPRLRRALPHHELRARRDLRPGPAPHRARRRRRGRSRARRGARRLPRRPARARARSGALPPRDPRPRRQRRGRVRDRRRLPRGRGGRAVRAPRRDRAALRRVALAPALAREPAVPHARRLPPVQRRVRRRGADAARREPRRVRRSGRRPDGDGGELPAVRVHREHRLAPPRPAVAPVLGRVPARAPRPRAPRGRAAVPRVARARRVQPALLPRPRRDGAPRDPRARGARARRARARSGVGRRAVPVSAAAGTVVWFTGLPASGKTTLARRVRELLPEATLLDGDELREVLGAGGYERGERDAFYAIAGRLAALLARQGRDVLVAATAPRRRHREAARALAPRFLEVHVATPREACEARDPKGLYARARAGEAPRLPGAGEPYEPPVAPDVVATGGDDAAAVAAIVSAVRRAR
ncbi:MAG: adenylyl-sulfate kinase [Deltaproteobacteria bacterium]|nr:adenylyl-sulfate kinase [Deltaproteobacteria bacterium]